MTNNIVVKGCIVMNFGMQGYFEELKPYVMLKILYSIKCGLKGLLYILLNGSFW